MLPGKGSEEEAIAIPGQDVRGLCLCVDEDHAQTHLAGLGPRRGGERRKEENRQEEPTHRTGCYWGGTREIIPNRGILKSGSARAVFDVGPECRQTAHLRPKHRIFIGRGPCGPRATLTNPMWVPYG